MGIYITWDKKSVQTLSTILLPIIITAVGTVFFQLIGIRQSLGKIQNEFEVVKFQNYKFQLESDRIIILEQVLEGGETRKKDMSVIYNEIMNKVKQSETTVEELELKIFQNQLACVEDYGKLQQLDTENYAFISKAARLLSEVLKKEQTLWLTLDKMLRANKSNKLIDLKNAMTNYLEEMTNYVLTMRSIRSQFPGIVDEAKTHNQKLAMENDQFKNKLQTLNYYYRLYSRICIGGLIISLVLAIIIVNIQVTQTKP